MRLILLALLCASVLSATGNLVGVSPNSGIIQPGVATQFTFQLEDEVGIVSTQIAITSNGSTSSNACVFTISDERWSLMANSGSAPPGNYGWYWQLQSLSNSQCSVTMPSSGGTNSGGYRYITVTITFTTAFQGIKSIYWKKEYNNLYALGEGVAPYSNSAGSIDINVPVTAAPAFSPAPGTYTSGQWISLSSTTPGATIRYTTDGSTPTSTTGTVYSSPIAVNATSTLRAIALKSGWTDSPVTTGTFTITGTVATPTFTPVAATYTSGQSVTIGTATPGSTIRYTTDGSTPTTNNGTVYSGPVAVTATTTLKAIGYQAGWANSALASATYTITGTVATPAFSVAAGTYTSAQSVGISTTPADSTIRYTTDGSTPSQSSGTLYSGPIPISATTTLKAVAYKTGWNNSAVASATYTITGTVATPAFSVAAGTYTSAQSVSISTTPADATIRYTTDGSAPSPSSGTVYTGAISISATTTLKAIAYKAGWNNSAVASAVYTITGTVAAPLFSPTPGTYSVGQAVSLSSATPASSIRYTTDTSHPSSTNGTLYTGPLTLTTGVTINAIAYQAGWLNSPEVTGTYTVESITPPTAPSGPTAILVNSTGTFAVGGSSSSLGHAIQYRFLWGDSNDSGWLAPGTGAANHSYSAAGAFSISVQARCSIHPAVISQASGPLNVTVASPPPKVTLATPMDGAVDRPSSLTLTWEAATGAIAYDLYLGIGTPTQLVPDLFTTSFTPSPALNPSTTYAWRVVAKNSAGNGPSSDTWTFTTSSAPPPAPALTSPTDGATNQAVTPTLRWSLPPGATSFDVYLDSETPVTNTTSTSYTPSQALGAQTSHVWRVVAKNGGGAGPSSATFTFTTGTPPGEPQLLLPVNSAADQPAQPILRWAPATGATEYDVYYGSGTPTLQKTVQAPTTVYMPETALAASTTYSWRVVARNPAGSVASAAWTFVTAGQAPAPATLSSPGNGATSLALTAPLIWAVSERATEYDVYFGTTNDPPHVARVRSNTYSPTWNPFTTYYWRVVAVNGGGAAASSPTWSFTTQLPATALLSPSNGAAGISKVPTLTWNWVTGANSYDLYLSSGGGAQPIQIMGTSYTPSAPLTEQTAYTWYVVAKSGSTTAAESEHWTFTTTGAASASATPAATREYIRFGGRVVAIETMPTGLSGLTSSKGTLNPSETAVLTATLTAPAPVGGATIQVTSSAPATVANPSAIVVAAGQTSGTTTITAVAPSAAVNVTLVATYGEPGGGAASVTVRVLPPAPLPTLTEVRIDPTSTLTSGGTGKVNVTLSSVAPSGDATVTLAATPAADAGLFPVTSVTVPAGQASASTANITAGPTLLTKTLIITATYNNTSRNTTLNILPTVALHSISAPSTVVRGTTFSATVTLTGVAPSPISIALTSSNGSVTPPSKTAIVPQNESAVAVAFTAAADGDATLTATYNGVSKQTTVTVVPPLPTVSSVYIAPPEVIPTSTATVSVALTGPAPSGGAVVSLLSTNPSVFAVPPTMTVAAGQSIGTVPVVAQSVSANTPVTVIASYNNSSREGTATITAISLSSSAYWLTAGQSAFITLYPTQTATWSVEGPGSISPSAPPYAATYTAPLSITSYTSTTIRATTPNGSSATIVIHLQAPIQDVSPNGFGTRPVGQPITYTWSGPDTVFPTAPWTNPNEYLILTVSSYADWATDMGCQVQYKPATRTVYVAADNVQTSTFQSGALGSQQILGSNNSKCNVNLTGSDGKNGIVQYVSMPITFKPPLGWAALYGPVSTTKWVFVSSYLNGLWQTTQMAWVTLQ